MGRRHILADSVHDYDDISVVDVTLSQKERKKEIPYKRAFEDIGSAGYIQSYRGQGYEGAITGKCFYDFPVFPSLCDGCALRGACRARPMSVCGGPLLLGGLMMRRGRVRVCSATIPSR